MKLVEKIEELELTNPISQSLMIVATNSIENVKALLKMGEAIIEQVNTISSMIREHSQMILELQSRQLELFEKLTTLSEVVHTHFGPTVVTH